MYIYIAPIRQEALAAKEMTFEFFCKCLDGRLSVLWW